MAFGGLVLGHFHFKLLPNILSLRGYFVERKKTRNLLKEKSPNTDVCVLYVRGNNNNYIFAFSLSCTSLHKTFPWHEFGKHQHPSVFPFSSPSREYRDGVVRMCCSYSSSDLSSPYFFAGNGFCQTDAVVPFM